MLSHKIVRELVTRRLRGRFSRDDAAKHDLELALDEPDDGMSNVHCARGSVLTIELKNVGSFRERCPEQFDAIVECSAFVNWRRNEVGEPTVLALNFHGARLRLALP